MARAGLVKSLSDINPPAPLRRQKIKKLANPTWEFYYCKGKLRTGNATTMQLISSMKDITYSQAVEWAKTYSMMIGKRVYVVLNSRRIHVCKGFKV